MYLETGVCAQCGKKLEASANFAPHNVDYASKAKHHLHHFPGWALRIHLLECGERPYFCSPRCIERLIEDGSAAAIEADYRKKLEELQKDMKFYSTTRIPDYAYPISTRYYAQKMN
jgi:hypothetical protein